MKFRPLAAFLTAAGFCAAPALANPVNATVVNGNATFNQTSPVLTVTNSNGAIINWDKFNISTSAATRFVQPSSSSVVLNRVLNDPTAIYGRISSNGRVFLINPAGITFTPGGRVNINAPVARLAAPSPAPAMPHAVTTALLPPRGAPLVAASANASRMVDGAVTLRMPLVDASAITVH